MKSARRLALSQVALEDVVEDARAPVLQVQVAQVELPHRRCDVGALAEMDIERAHQARPVRARLAVDQDRIVERLE